MRTQLHRDKENLPAILWLFWQITLSVFIPRLYAISEMPNLGCLASELLFAGLCFQETQIQNAQWRKRKVGWDVPSQNLRGEAASSCPSPECTSVHSLVTNGVCAVRMRNVWPVVMGIQVTGISQGWDQWRDKDPKLLGWWGQVMRAGCLSGILLFKEVDGRCVRLHS